MVRRLLVQPTVHPLGRGMGVPAQGVVAEPDGKVVSAIPWRDRLAIPVIKVVFYLATPAYRDRIKRLIVGGMKHGY